MKFTPLSISGLWLIEPQRFGDARGYFSETYSREQFEEHIGRVDFVQDNESMSTRGVLRGLHMQGGADAQAKLVRVSAGEVLDVAVDLRDGSPTYGQHCAVRLSHDNGRQLFIPRGFAHGFVVLSDTACFQYKVDNKYAPQSELSVRFDDPELAIDWLLDPGELILSPKDSSGIRFADFIPWKG
ncbi:MAG: dTDP-4-dehydrorhamnose 3,5-epimerase [Paramuribaculum sp.]|nr:dTDP-4-dehydrorhamnose 3,5-epimerase [Paramuribaculum sp.]